MIVDSTSIQQIFREMRQDSISVKFRLQKEIRRAVKALDDKQPSICVAGTSFRPFIYTIPHRVPSTQNNYILYYYAPSMSSRMITGLGSILVYNNHFGQRNNLVMGNCVDQGEDYPVIYEFTGHFLARYRERFLKNDTLSTDEVLVTYVERNRSGVSVEMNADMNPKWAEYGSKYALKVDDGITFLSHGELTVDGCRSVFICNKTFVSNDMLTHSQNKAQRRVIRGLLDEFEKKMQDNIKKQMRKEIEMYGGSVPLNDILSS